MIALHQINPAAVGLAPRRSAEGYVARQLARWSSQIEAVNFEEISILREVHDSLAASIPPQLTGIVHGDFRPGNIAFDCAGTALAVFDWELATVGDTMADLGWLLVTWANVDEDFCTPAPGPSAAGGYLERSDLIDRYASLTDRDMSRLDYYMAFARWRGACIGVGVRHRYGNGVMGDDGFDGEGLDEQIQALAEQARADLA